MGAASLIALKRNDLIDFLNPSGNFSARTVSSVIAVAIYCFIKACKDRTRICAFSLEIPNAVGSFLSDSGKLSPLIVAISESSFPVADAQNISYN